MRSPCTSGRVPGARSDKPLTVMADAKKKAFIAVPPQAIERSWEYHGAIDLENYTEELPGPWPSPPAR